MVEDPDADIKVELGDYITKKMEDHGLIRVPITGIGCSCDDVIDLNYEPHRLSA